MYNKLLLYTAVLRPILTYGSPVWGYAADSNIKTLEVAQNSIIRNIDCLLLAYQDKDPSSIPFTKDLLRKYLLHLVRKDFMSGIAADVLLHAVYTEYVYRHGTTSHHKKRRQQQQKMSNGTVPYHENPSSVLPDIRTLGKIISDIDLKAPSVKLVNLLTLHPSVSVYMYEFDYASSDDVIANKYVALNVNVETCIQDLKSLTKETNQKVLLAACKHLFPKEKEKKSNTLGEKLKYKIRVFL
ncbi:carboxylic ester hydrolase [Trichonephila clavipes]|nr:carboxylic ester hydrolase [Trichonephila clavipes]